MAKSVFKKGHEKASRRKKFTEEAKSSVDTSKSVFKKGREKAARRKKFAEEAKKAGKKEGHRRITKDPKGGTLARGRRPGQTKGAAASDESKAALYKRAQAVKKKKSGEAGRAAVSTFSKKQLQSYLLKYE